MPDSGYIQVKATTSRAQLPLENAAISITMPDGTAIAMRLTDRNGLTQPVEVPTPELSAGLTPDTGILPFTVVNL